MTRSLKFYLLIFCFALSATHAISHAADLDSKELALSRGYIRALMDADEKELDLFTTILEISFRVQKDLRTLEFDQQEYQARFDRMQQDLSSRITDEIDSDKVIDLVNQYLFDQFGFTTDRSRLFDTTLENLLMNQVLDNTKGQCLSLSLVYLSLAERLDLPMYGVMAPGHFFVRWDKDGQRRNIETTDLGKDLSDAYYRQTHLNGYHDQTSLKNLGIKQVLAVYLSNLANHYKIQGAHDHAIFIFQQALRVMPQQASFHTNLGNAYERNKDFRQAFVQYRQAISLNPYLCEAHYNMGLLHFLYTKRYDLARRYGYNAIKLGCRLHPEYRAFLLKE